jgi:hypothetical protein
MTTTLWQYNAVTGYWKSIHRELELAVAQQYLAIFQKDEPRTLFVLSRRRPPYPKSPLD